MLQHFDGVLLPGGGDVDPRRYGQEPDDDTLYGIVQAHDDLDIAVCLAAIELDLPMLALCRGMQVLNVALGGTLVQDIGNSDHWMREHTVRLDGRLQARRRPRAPRTSSTATPCTTRASATSPSRWSACGWAPDGQLEAVELPTATWIVGAQWHPEDTATHKPQQQAIYDELVRRAAARAAAAA